VTGNAGLRRFVAGSASAEAPPAAPPAPPASPRAPSAPSASPAPSPTVSAPSPETSAPPQPGEEACEFCATQIPAEHGHVADLEQSTLMCACRACYLLFTHSGAGQTRQQDEQPGEDRRIGRARYRSIPDRYRGDPGHPLTPADWDALEIPVGLAFFLHSSASGEQTAFYPSPAGATECRLDLEAWGRITAAHPLLGAAEPDVEAILISRGQADRDVIECFLVPIDACYELAGRMRLQWRGFDGGAEARQSIADFLDRVRERSRDFSREP